MFPTKTSETSKGKTMRLESMSSAVIKSHNEPGVGAISGILTGLAPYTTDMSIPKTFLKGSPEATPYLFPSSVPKSLLIPPDTINSLLRQHSSC